MSLLNTRGLGITMVTTSPRRNNSNQRDNICDLFPLQALEAPFCPIQISLTNCQTQASIVERDSLTCGLIQLLEAWRQRQQRWQQRERKITESYLTELDRVTAVSLLWTYQPKQQDTSFIHRSTAAISWHTSPLSLANAVSWNSRSSLIGWLS